MPNLRETSVVCPWVDTGVYKLEGRLRDRKMKESDLLELMKVRDPSPTMYYAAVPVRSVSRVCALCSKNIMGV